MHVLVLIEHVLYLPPHPDVALVLPHLLVSHSIIAIIPRPLPPVGQYRLALLLEQSAHAEEPLGVLRLAGLLQQLAELGDLAPEHRDNVRLSSCCPTSVGPVELPEAPLELHLDFHLALLSPDLGFPEVDGLRQVERLLVHPLQQRSQVLVPGSGHLLLEPLVGVGARGGGRLDGKVDQAPSACNGIAAPAHLITEFLIVVGARRGEVLVLVGLAKLQRLGHQRRGLLGVPVVVEVVEGSVAVNIVGVEVRDTVHVTVVGGLVLDENVPIHVLV
ncbi:hypothetical protein PG988_007464 [Apiospora saccharicola]